MARSRRKYVLAGLAVWVLMLAAIVQAAPWLSHTPSAGSAAGPFHPLPIMPFGQVALDRRRDRLFIAGFTTDGPAIAPGGIPWPVAGATPRVDGMVSTVDMATGRVIATVSAEVSPAAQLVVDEYEGHVFTFSYDRASVLDAASGRVLRDVPIPTDA